jgi:hypothetical protein
MESSDATASFTVGDSFIILLDDATSTSAVVVVDSIVVEVVRGIIFSIEICVIAVASIVIDVLAAFIVDVAVGNLDVGDGLICDETVGVAVVVWIAVVVNVGVDVDALVVAVDCVFDDVTVWLLNSVVKLVIMGVTDVVLCDSGAVEMFGTLPVKSLSDVCSVEVFVDCWYVLFVVVAIATNDFSFITSVVEVRVGIAAVGFGVGIAVDAAVMEVVVIDVADVCADVCCVDVAVVDVVGNDTSKVVGVVSVGAVDAAASNSDLDFAFDATCFDGCTAAIFVDICCDVAPAFTNGHAAFVSA